MNTKAFGPEPNTTEFDLCGPDCICALPEQEESLYESYDNGYYDGYDKGYSAGLASGARQALDNVQAMVETEFYPVNGDLAEEEPPFDYASIEEELGFVSNAEDDPELRGLLVLWFLAINEAVDQLLSAGQRFAVELDGLSEAVEWNFGEFAEAHNMLVDEVEGLREDQDSDAVVIDAQATQIADLNADVAILAGELKRVKELLHIA